MTSVSPPGRTARPAGTSFDFQKARKPVFSNEDYLADLLVEAGAVDPDVLDQARRKGGSVIERLLSDTDLSENTVCAVLAQNAGIEAIDLAQMAIPPDVASAIPDEIARRYKSIPVADDGVFLTVAVGDPFDFETMDSLPHVLRSTVFSFSAKLAPRRGSTRPVS